MAMIIIGAILAGLGSIFFIIGIVRNNTYEIVWEYFWETGRTDPGTVWIILGIIMVLAGAGLLVFGILKKKGAAGAKPRVTPVTGPTCPRCGTPLKPGSKFCGACGYTLSGPPTVKPTERACPFCESIVSPTATFCPVCGNNIADSAAPTSAPAADPAPTYIPPAPAPSGSPAPSRPKIAGDLWSRGGDDEL